MLESIIPKLLLNLNGLEKLECSSKAKFFNSLLPTSREDLETDSLFIRVIMELWHSLKSPYNIELRLVLLSLNFRIPSPHVFDYPIHNAIM